MKNHINIGRVKYNDIDVFLKLRMWSVGQTQRVQIMFGTAMFEDTDSFLDEYQLWRKYAYGAAINLSVEECKAYLEFMKTRTHFVLFFKGWDEITQEIVLEAL